MLMSGGCTARLLSAGSAVLLVLSLLTPPSHCETLYLDANSVVSLAGEEEFSKTVFDSATAWIVEFYQSTCGDCRKFAPMYAAHAADVQAWSPIIRVAAMNCADEVNVPVCTSFNIQLVPEIRLFPAQHSNTGSDGAPFVGINLHTTEEKSDKKTDVVLRRRMIDIVKLQSHRPTSWPNLDFNRKLGSKLVYNKSSRFGVVYQHPPSYLGAELTLDLLACPSVKVHVITNAEDIGADSVHSLPSCVAWNGQQKNLLSNCSRHAARDLFLSLCGRVHQGADKVAAHNDMHPISSPVLPGVYMTDLMSTLAFIVHREVALHPMIHGSALDGLVQFLQAVHYCMPAPPEVRQYVITLLRHLRMAKGSSHGLSSVAWSRFKSIQTGSSRLPHEIRWVGCAGSRPGKRGYPCGLWTLFHTVTAHCALMADQQPVEDLSLDRRTLTRRRVAGVDGRWALLAVRDYIEHFFGCADCRSHFLEMSANVVKEVTSSHGAVLWLWQAHNKVNHRLKSDSSSDPAHPKVQFPPPSLCGQCYQSANAEAASTDTQWNADEVLKFLLKFYGPTGVHWSDEVKTWEHEHRDSAEDEGAVDDGGGTGAIFHSPDVIPHSVYYVAISMVGWLAIIGYIRCRPTFLRRTPNGKKPKQHMV